MSADTPRAPRDEAAEPEPALARLRRLEAHTRTGVRLRVERAGPGARAVASAWDAVRRVWVTRGARRTLRRLKAPDGLRVHLGCGADLRPGWVNVDLSLHLTRPRTGARRDGTVYVNHDLRRGLPLADGSAAFVYSSHFFEHLPYAAGVRLMADCFRALRPGGTFRIVIPDFARCFRAYLEGDAEFFSLIPLAGVAPEVAPHTATLIDYVNYAVYQNGEHVCIHDEEKLGVLLRDVGFTRVRRAEFDPAVDLDTPERRRYSLYVEAVR